MTTLAPIDPKTLAARLRTGAATLVDIREPDEYEREHIEGAVSMPLSQIGKSHVRLEPGADVVFHCKSGMRTHSNCERLARIVDCPAAMLEGGLEAWKQAGLPVARDRGAPIEINRQVQIAAGLLVLSGVTLGVVVDPLFLALAGAIGAGLTFAGLSGWCGMAKLLAAAPWNKRA
jgi:rhodanese-related sulfurtransferase